MNSIPFVSSTFGIDQLIRIVTTKMRTGKIAAIKYHFEKFNLKPEFSVSLFPAILFVITAAIEGVNMLANEITVNSTDLASKIKV